MNIFPQICFAPEGSGGGSGDSGGASSAPSAPADGGGSSSPSSAPSGASPSSEGAPVAPATPPTPSPSEAQPRATPHDNSLGDGLFDFGDMNEVEVDEDDSPPASTAKPEAPVQPPAQEAPTGAEPAAQPPAQATPPEPRAPEPAGPQETSPQSSPTEPLQIAQALQKEESAIIDHLAANEFQLSKEDLEALEADAPAYIPKLLARVYFKANVNFMNQIGRLVPQMVQQQTRVMKQNMENENRFYKRWPDLDREKHGPLVMKFGSVYRQANPQASMEQMIEEVGPMVMTIAKIQPKPAGHPGNGAARPPQPTPFQPAMGGPAAPPVTAPEDPWAGMGQASADED